MAACQAWGVVHEAEHGYRAQIARIEHVQLLAPDRPECGHGLALTVPLTGPSEAYWVCGGFEAPFGDALMLADDLRMRRRHAASS
jgi:hypothetical protein